MRGPRCTIIVSGMNAEQESLKRPTGFVTVQAKTACLGEGVERSKAELARAGGLAKFGA